MPGTFNDANKRSSWLTTEVLIANSGFELTLGEDDRLDDLGKWFEARVSAREMG